jgi:bifunctional DNA-binding transcriptional regulator/antitoxin component of YhaV-PrlF toxin-antitoxin module
MAQKLKMTAKRQVTFPVAVCESLAVYPGDTLVLRDGRAGGRRVWTIEAEARPNDEPWLGALRPYAERKTSHALPDIRAAVARKRGGRT